MKLSEIDDYIVMQPNVTTYLNRTFSIAEA